MLWKCCTQYDSRFRKLSSGHRTGKGQFSFQSPKVFKLPHNCTHLTHQQSNAQNSPSQTSTLCEPWTSLQMFNLDLEKEEEPEIKLPIFIGSLKNQESVRKASISALLTTTKSLCGSQQTGKFFKRWEYQTTWLASWETCMQVKKQQIELDMEQQTGSKLGKAYIRLFFVTLLN